jgi:hypothetical protein
VAATTPASRGRASSGPTIWSSISALHFRAPLLEAFDVVLRTLLERAGLQLDRLESSGNRSVVAANLYHWPAYRRWHSLRNEPDLPLQLWVVARKPGQTAG